MSATGSRPWDIVDLLCAWAQATPWCGWLELGGSLAEGRDDQYSDVDAGLGVSDQMSVSAASAAVLKAAGGFAAVADSVVQNLGVVSAPTDHVIVQYEDGRQLSLVVLPASDRPGVPPGARVLFDRTGRLGETWLPSQLEASFEDQREWAFLSWLNPGDAAKHGRRGSVWRAVHSLDQARDYGWKLYAASQGLEYPSFGPVTVETAKRQPPPGIERTFPCEFTWSGIRTAALGLAAVLGPLTDGLSVGGVRLVTERSLSVGWD